jgi:hypothetical protein
VRRGLEVARCILFKEHTDLRLLKSARFLERSGSHGGGVVAEKRSESEVPGFAV